MKLNKQAQELRDSIIGYLDKNGKADTVELQQIDYLVTYTHIFYEQQKKVLNDGIVQVYKNGASNISGDMVAMNKAFEYVEKQSRGLGIHEIMKTKLMGYGKYSKSSKGKLG